MFAVLLIASNTALNSALPCIQVIIIIIFFIIIIIGPPAQSLWA